MVFTTQSVFFVTQKLQIRIWRERRVQTMSVREAREEEGREGVKGRVVTLS